MKEATVQSPQGKTDETPHHENSHRSGRPVGILAVCCIVLGIVVIVLGSKVHQLSAVAADTQTQLTQSKSEAARAQSDSDQAKSASAQLQSQLDKVGSQRSNLQSQLDKSKAQSADLQSQLDKSKAQSADLQSQLDKANTQSADLQAQLKQANDGSADLQKQLDQAKSQSADLQSQLQKAQSDIANLQPLAQKTQQMPVATSFEKSFWSSGLTLHIKNLNPVPLQVNITVNGSEKPRAQSGTIKSGETLDVAKLAVGERVVIASEGYEPVNLTVH